MKLLVTKTYKLFLFLGITCLPFFTLKAQAPDDKLWHAGELVIENKDTIRGLINYDFVNNFIQYQKGEDYRILLPGKVTSGYFTHSLDSSKHQLLVYSIKTGEDYYRPYFFELVDTTGKIKLVKQYYWIQRSSNFGQWGGFSVTNEKITLLYSVNKDGTVLFIKPKKRFVLSLMEDKKELVKEKVKKEGWRYSNTFQLIKIIQFYNKSFT